jgi:hypothetical protein
MNTEIQSIITCLETVLDGQPWFGRAVYEMLGETNEEKVMIKPNQSGHTLLELLYHMNTWADFTLKSLETGKITDITTVEKLDWRSLDPGVHTWKKGMSDFQKTHESIIKILRDKDDDFLKEIVEHRKYNFRFLLNGLIQHDIYHVAQIAYINKFLV